jgi:hypothetical protein
MRSLREKFVPNLSSATWCTTNKYFMHVTRLLVQETGPKHMRRKTRLHFACTNIKKTHTFKNGRRISCLKACKRLNLTKTFARHLALIFCYKHKITFFFVKKSQHFTTVPPLNGNQERTQWSQQSHATGSDKTCYVGISLPCFLISSPWTGVRGFTA